MEHRHSHSRSNDEELHYDSNSNSNAEYLAWRPPPQPPSSFNPPSEPTMPPPSSPSIINEGNGHTSPPLPPPRTTIPKPPSSSSPPYEFEPETFPRGRKSLSGISLRAFLLGQIFALSLLWITILLLPSYYPQSQPQFQHQHGAHPIWRLPFFFTTLSLFHFLEFWITARFNPPSATVSAFLLTSNGTAYNLAHTISMLECLITSYILPTYYPSSSTDTPWLARTLATPPWHTSITVLGLGCTIMGQFIRSMAMAQAGTNFNHIVQTRRRGGHELVTRGIYAWLRHPSYFGFFWWAIGTQVVMGNKICLGIYVVVLWRFFRGRIEKEEEFLVRFFGKEYLDYRAKTSVGIPFIR